MSLALNSGGQSSNSPAHHFLGKKPTILLQLIFVCYHKINLRNFYVIDISLKKLAESCLFDFGNPIVFIKFRHSFKIIKKN